MERKEFLSLIGLSASAMVMACIGCSKGNSSGTSAPSNVDFTLDISQSTNASLNTNGGYLYSNGIIVARTLTGNFIAVQQICTHENFSIVYQPNNHRFYCDGHGGTFSEAGQVTGGPPPAALRSYNTSLSGTILRVYS
ncbi:MAG TPA: Rieske (2Fe-2S) protein [Flavisolibacter sp.]|jgi:cytochrome b6-f complex iron-sulfur subunit|nr:Rieske (2Fe-2S) protein [Flavisolibacter sp.]